MKPRLKALPLTPEDHAVLEWREQNYWGFRSGDFYGSHGEFMNAADRRDADIMWSLGDALRVEGANPAVFGKYRGLSIAHSLVATVLEIGPVLLRKVNIVYFA